MLPPPRFPFPGSPFGAPRIPDKRDLLAGKEKELLDKGYLPGVARRAVTWALSRAEGIAGEVTSNREEKEKLMGMLLPRFLDECELWAKGVARSMGRLGDG